jgi:DNA-binding XRE family transcriptional regulator
MILPLKIKALSAVRFASTFTEKDKVAQVVDDAEKKLLAVVGQRLRETRAAQGLSLEQLARLTGISAPALSLIETGKRDPRLTTLKRIADALRVPLATLIDAGSDATEPGPPSSSEGYDLGEYE